MTPPVATERDFTISRVFSAPRALVFDAWINPRHLAQWWGPRGFANPVCEVDARVGGHYQIVMGLPDGGRYPCKGKFIEVSPPEKLVMTMDVSGHPEEWHDKVNPARRHGDGDAVGPIVQTVTFEETSPGTTRVTVHSRFTSASIRDAMVGLGMTQGWSQSLDRQTDFLDDATTPPERLIATSRVINAPREKVFAAWIDPKRIARWWGPAGFTNTIEKFEPRPGGEWVLTMHGPDGKNYPNRSFFLDVVPNERFSFQHSSPPHFFFLATFEDAGPGKTLIRWRMRFPDADVCGKVRVYAAPANEQNLDKLETELGLR